MPFNPDEYLKKQSTDKGSGFNPDAYLAKAKSPEKEGAAQAGLESFGNAATLGYLPHLQAAASKVTPNPSAGVDADLESKGFKITQPAEKGYVQTRDENIKRQADQKKDFPWATTAGTAAGIVGGGLMVPGAALAKGASLGAKAWQGAKAGGAMGALMNPGDVEGDVTVMPAERLKNASLGFGLGGALPVATSLLGKGKDAVQGWLGNKAEEKAFRSLGRGTPTQMEKLVDSGQNKEIGRELLDAGAIPVLGTPGRIAGRVEKLKESAGNAVGELVKGAGDAKRIDAAELAVNFLDDPMVAKIRKTPGMEGVASQIDKAAETLASNGPMSLEQAQALRQGLDESINFAKKTNDLSGNQKVLYEIRTRIRDKMNEAINQLNPGAPKDQLLSANRKYSHMATASDVLDKELARNQSNRAISLTDTIAAGAGASTGNPGAALVLGAINKAGRTFGNSVQARGYDALAKTLAKSPGVVAAAESNPGVVSRLAAAIGQESTGGKQNYSMEKDPILNDPEVLKLFKNDDSLLQNVQDPHRRALIKDALKRLPASR